MKERSVEGFNKYEDNVNQAADRLAHDIREMMRLLKLYPLTVLDDAQFGTIISNLTSIVRRLLSKDARCIVVVTDENGRTQLGSNCDTPADAADVLEQVIETCRGMHEGFIQRN